MSDDVYEDPSENTGVYTQILVCPGIYDPVQVEVALWDEPVREDELAKKVTANLSLEQTINLINRLQRLVDIGSQISPLVPFVKRPPKKKSAGKKGTNT